MNWSSQRARRALLAGLILTAPLCAYATEPYTLTHDVRVRIDARLQLMGFGDERPAHRALLEAKEDQPLAFSHAFELGTRSLGVDVSMRPRVDQAAGICRLALEVEVRPPGAQGARLNQVLSLEPGRVRLVEAWGGSRMDERLVIAITASWEKIPRVRLLRDGAEPVAIVLEVVEHGRVLQRHELGAVVGESSRFMVRHAPGHPSTALQGGAEEVSAALEFLPKSIEGGKLDLSVALVVAAASEEDPGEEPMRLEMREELGPGLSLVLPLPERAGGGDRTHIRVTPWF